LTGNKGCRALGDFPPKGQLMSEIEPQKKENQKYLHYFSDAKSSLGGTQFPN
jgi:hypothetical protein